MYASKEGRERSNVPAESAPVAQWKEQCYTDAEVASSNPAEGPERDSNSQPNVWQTATLSNRATSALYTELRTDVQKDASESAQMQKHACRGVEPRSRTPPYCLPQLRDGYNRKG